MDVQRAGEERNCPVFLWAYCIEFCFVYFQIWARGLCCTESPARVVLFHLFIPELGAGGLCCTEQVWHGIVLLIQPMDFV